MTSAESLNLIIAVGAAISTALSALAAFRSAASAEATRRALEADQLRHSRREVAILVSSCAYEYSRVQFLAHTLSALDKAKAIFAGGLGGSRHRLAVDAVANRLAKAEEFFQAAATFRDDPVAFNRLVLEDVERLQIDLPIRLSGLRAIADELYRDSASSEAQMLQYRERTISGGGR